MEERHRPSAGKHSGFTCVVAAVGGPDFGKRMDPSVLGAEHGGLGAVVKMGV